MILENKWFMGIGALLGGIVMLSWGIMRLRESRTLSSDHFEADIKTWESLYPYFFMICGASCILGGILHMVGVI